MDHHDGGVMHMSGPMWMPMDPPTLERLLAWHLQPVPVLPVLVALALAAYVFGVVRLHRRGASWPVLRTISFVAGVLSVLAVTATGIEGYGMMLFSVHMAQHMALVMVSPILLVGGAPITLLLRALPAAGRGSGVRRGVVRALGSRTLAVLTSLPVRWFVFLSGLYGIYFTGVFDGLMSSVWGHNVMLLHFLFSGIWFFGPLVSADPWPGRPAPFQRLLETLASTPFHAFFGIAVMSASQPIVSFFNDPPASWNIDLMADQDTAGGIAWATSEVPTLIVAGVILFAWFGIEKRVATRHDRSEERTDDAALKAYNERLAAIALADAER